MANYLTNDTDLTKVANAIRTKSGTSAPLEYPDEYVSAIEAIYIPKIEASKNHTVNSSGTTTITPDSTYDGIGQVNLTVPAGSATTPTTTITVNPSIGVSSGGLITATASASQSITPTVSAGYVSSGTSGTISVSGSNTSQLTTLGAITYHPSTTSQTITSGKYITGTQTINAVTISGLSAENIVSGVTVKIGDSDDDDCIASVTGTASGGVVITQEQDSHGGIIEHITAGSIETLQSKSVTISTAGTQTITADNGYDGLSEVIVTTTGGGATEPYVEYVCNSSGDATSAKMYGFTEGIPIGLFAFNSYLTTVNLNDTTYTSHKISNYVFRDCSQLTTITGTLFSSNQITQIGSYAFNNCQLLPIVSLPTALTTIDMYAFYNCKLLSVTSLPSTVTTINNYAFQGCTSLALTSLPNGLTTINTSVFYGCTSLALTSLPSTLRTINNNGFYGCTSLALTLIPSTVNSVGSYAFRQCTGLTTIEIACGSINTYCFYGCTGLTKVWIRSTCTTISATSAANSPFVGCSTSLQIYAEPSTAPSGWGSYFNRTGTSGGTTVTVVYNQTTKPW